MSVTDELKITDKHGFRYRVIVKHSPATGCSFAYYEDDIIASREYGRMSPPIGDNDKEWEEWEDRFREYIVDILMDIESDCKIYFNKLN